ncbi:MAG: hypothetical protein RIE32_06975 [Phycisphaerales bacterium]
MRAVVNGTVAALACVATAAAQDAAAIDAGDVRHYAELLALTDEQEAQAIERYRAYRAEMRDAASAIREMAMDQAADSAEDLRENGLAGAYFRSFLRATADAEGTLELFARPLRIEQELIDDLLALATTPQQREGVERVERAWRRDRVSAAQSPFGDSADVVDLARRLGHDQREPIAGILLEYELAIDPIRRVEVGMLPMDFAALQDAKPAEDVQSLGLRAKKTNIQFARRIKQALSEEHHDRWDRAVREAFWPEPYERSGPQKIIGALRLNRTLTDKDCERLEAIAADYEERAAPINRDWAAALDAHLHAMAAEDWDASGKANETIYESRAARRALDEEFEDRLAEFSRQQQTK